MNKGRFEAFSDSVFAFAITLLILGIALPAFKNPPPSERELAHALLRLWPNLLAYILSFSVIGIMWQNHHALFRLVGTVDRMTVFLNLSLLGVTVFIPFATSVLGAYPTMRSSTFLYGLTLTSSGSIYNLLLWRLTQMGAFHANVSEATIRPDDDRLPRGSHDVRDRDACIARRACFEFCTLSARGRILFVPTRRGR